MISSMKYCENYNSYIYMASFYLNVFVSLGIQF